MIRTYPRAIMAALVTLAVAVVMIAVTVWAIVHAHAPEHAVLINTVQHCAQEDGSGEAQTYPCVWDGGSDGNALYYGKRYTLYVRGTDGGCFEPMPADTYCYDIDTEGWYAIDPAGWYAS